MKHKIEKYINSIGMDRALSHVTFEYEDKFTFLGDGLGDFEERAESTTEECLVNYHRYCLQQISWAKKALEELRTKGNKNVF